MLPRAVSDHYRRQQRLIVATLGLVRREWSTVDFTDIDGSWAKVAPRVNLLTASAQLGSARNGAAYIGATLAELGDDVPVLGDVNPRAFAGFASDGRPLGSLLDGAAYRAKAAQSLEAGGAWLDMAVHTQVADAARGAAATAIAARPGVGWVRMVNPPCCGDCANLAGKEFKYNEGFQRHPRCDCVHVPKGVQTSWEGLTEEPSLDQITDLTAAERKALAEGSDLSRVINARRGGGRGKMTTTELAKRGQVRLTPDGIFARAGSREEALSLLKEHGYLTNTARRVSTATVEAPRAARAARVDLSGIRAAKTPQEVGEALQRSIGGRGKVAGFDHPTISVDKARAAAEQVARLSSKYPQVRFDVLVEEVKDKRQFAHATIKLGNGAGDPDTYALVFSRTKLTARSKADDLFQKSVDAGWFRVAEGVDTDTFTSMTTHEFGHLVDYASGNYRAAKVGRGDYISAQGTAAEMAKARGYVQPDPYFAWRNPRADPVKVQQYHEWTDFIESQISGYGRTSQAEGIAEAFHDVEINGELATDASKEIVRRLLALLREVSP